MVKLSFPELDYAERWCWNHFGPMDGECRQKYSGYRICTEDSDHKHVGTWLSHWHLKTDYDFGYCEFHFSKLDNRNEFLQKLPEFNWGEAGILRLSGQRSEA